MRILVAGTYVPFGPPDTPALLDSLEAALRRRGHEVDGVRVPFQPDCHNLLERVLALRCLDLAEAAGNRIDRLLAVGFPAYALRHPHKAAWLTSGAGGGCLPWAEGRCVPTSAECPPEHRQRSGYLDSRLLGEACAVLAGSQAIAESLKRRSGISASKIVYPPFPDTQATIAAGKRGEYFVYTTEDSPPARDAAVLEALRVTRRKFELKVIARSCPDRDWAAFSSLARRMNVWQRVEILHGLDRSEQAALVAGGRALVYTPVASLACGWPLVCALHVRTPVVVSSDAGAPLELVQNSHNGLVIEPSARRLADVFQWLSADHPRQAGRLVEAGYATLERAGVTWDAVAASLLD